MMQIEKIAKAGQVREGDLLLIGTNDGVQEARARIVLNHGTDREEVVIAKRSNRYFITSMLLDGTSWAKDVRIVRAH